MEKNVTELLLFTVPCSTGAGRQVEVQSMWDEMVLPATHPKPVQFLTAVSCRCYMFALLWEHVCRSSKLIFLSQRHHFWVSKLQSRKSLKAKRLLWWPITISLPLFLHLSQGTVRVGYRTSQKPFSWPSIAGFIFFLWKLDKWIKKRINKATWS